MKVNEVLLENKNNAFIKQHIQWLADQLDIKKLPKITLLNDPVDTTFGQYDPNTKSIKLVTGGRHPVDVLRTLAHELTHYKQDIENNLPDGAGETGTDQENEANANAGIVMRDFAQENPDQFGLDNGVAEGSLEEIDRRGFLRGLGAAAVAGAAGYQLGKDDSVDNSNPYTVDKLSKEDLKAIDTFLTYYAIIRKIGKPRSSGDYYIDNTGKKVYYRDYDPDFEAIIVKDLIKVYGKDFVFSRLKKIQDKVFVMSDQELEREFNRFWNGPPDTSKQGYIHNKLLPDFHLTKESVNRGVAEGGIAEVNDEWFKQGAFKTFKKAAPVKYQLAQQPGTVDTLEGPVRYEAGHYIMTGPKGERYPISPDKFNTLYDDNGDGTATPKKISKLAKLADHDGVLHTSWGDLQYTKGNDYIVRHGAGDYGAVKKDIFAQTYDNPGQGVAEHIVKHGSQFRLLSKKGKNLGTFPSHKAAAKHEGEVEYFKAHPKK